MLFPKTTALLALAAKVLADAANPAVASADSSVVRLTADNFESFISTNKLAIVEFFAPWCGHCKTLGPELEKAADILIEREIQVAQVDCTQDEDFCRDMDVKGYPTLKVFSADEAEPITYTGQRKSDAIVNFMVNRNSPVVWNLTDEDQFDVALDIAQQTMIIQLYDKLDETANQTFTEVAKTLRDKYVFARISDEAVNERYNVTGVKYLIFRPNEHDDAPELTHTEDLTKEALAEFVSNESKPLFGEINGSTFQTYVDANISLAYFFYWDPADKQAVYPYISRLAKEYRGRINFVGLDATKYGMHAANLNMREEFPLFAIHDIPTNLKYGMDQTESLVVAEIEPWLQKFVNGELEPKVKTEPTPEPKEVADEDSAVLKLVGSTHDAAIADKSKITLVEYYAPWCGHCQKLAPIYEQLAQLVKNDSIAKDKYVIAKLDGSSNDVSVQITGFPTLILYNKEAEPIRFDGQRDLKTLVEFIGYKESTSKGHDEL